MDGWMDGWYGWMASDATRRDATERTYFVMSAFCLILTRLAILICETEFVESGVVFNGSKELIQNFADFFGRRLHWI
jgi:hypothetical protein